MDEKKKQELNKAIAIIREECNKHSSCYCCPLAQKDNDGYGCPNPYAWGDIK